MAATTTRGRQSGWVAGPLKAKLAYGNGRGPDRGISVHFVANAGVASARRRGHDAGRARLSMDGIGSGWALVSPHGWLARADGIGTAGRRDAVASDLPHLSRRRSRSAGFA